MSRSTGEKLLGDCKEHVIAIMRTLPPCQPGGDGLTNMQVEKAAGLGLNLPEQNGWLTWSLLMALAEEGKVKILRRGKRRVRYFRLA
ncbi:MAG: hypothetical protein ACRD22_05670 [Terriglobia bacterium]